MTEAPFDPTGAVTFDLGAGRVSLKRSGPQVLVSSEQLGALCDAAGADATRSLGRALGKALGERVEAAATGSVPVGEFVQHLAGELALVGMGALRLERWGQAMVLVVEPTIPNPDLLKALLETALETSTGRKVACALLERTDTSHRYLVASPSVVERTEAQLREGKAWGELIVQLHAKEQPTQPRGDA